MFELEPDRAEIWRYLGYRGAIPDEKIQRKTENCIRQLKEVITPGFISAEYRLNFLNEENTLLIDSMQIHSAHLTRHLRDCCRVVLFAATLGLGPDRLTKRASVSAASDMVLYQAASAAMIEAYCDRQNERLKQQYREKGFLTKTRFSPGYGDFPLSHQEEILRILQAQKRIGLTLTNSLMMMPSKSVTALIGLSQTSDRQTTKSKGSCENCDKTDCAYRKE